MKVAHMKGIGDLLKEHPESSLALSTKLGHSQKTAVYKPGSMLSPDIEYASYSIVRLHIPKTVRIIYL